MYYNIGLTCRGEGIYFNCSAFLPTVLVVWYKKQYKAAANNLKLLFRGAIIWKTPCSMLGNACYLDSITFCKVGGWRMRALSASELRAPPYTATGNQVRPRSCMMIKSVQKVLKNSEWRSYQRCNTNKLAVCWLCLKKTAATIRGVVSDRRR